MESLLLQGEGKRYAVSLFPALRAAPRTAVSIMNERGAKTTTNHVEGRISTLP